MKIVSIEPTPSPLSMKLNVDERLPDGVRQTYTVERSSEAPLPLRRLLEIPDVASLYRAADFIALDRTPKGDWAAILAAAQTALGGEAGTGAGDAAEAATASYGEVHVFVQMFRSIPLQVRVRSASEERRAALSERIVSVATEAGKAATNLIAERHLEERGIRYGELDAVLEEVVRELDAAYDDARLAALLEAALRMDPQEAAANAAGGRSSERPAPISADEVADALGNADWRVRYAALERLRPTLAELPLLARALSDPQMSVRRLAVVYLGDLHDPAALPYLLRALQDNAVAVRRTAGDTLSDLGDPAALPAMSTALHDPSKLVRWRAARFLYEQGDDTVLEALRAAQDEPEFEVRLQIRMALERIEGGEAAAGSVWQQMTKRPRD